MRARNVSGQEAFPILAAVKCVVTWGTHIHCIKNQCSSLVDITYAYYRCHEPERKDFSIAGSISEMLGLVRWIFADANEASLRLATGLN